MESRGRRGPRTPTCAKTNNTAGERKKETESLQSIKMYRQQEILLGIN